MQESKKMYEAPTMEVIRLEGADVICTSAIQPDYTPGIGLNEPGADNDIRFWG